MRFPQIRRSPALARSVNWEGAEACAPNRGLPTGDERRLRPAERMRADFLLHRSYLGGGIYQFLPSLRA